MELHRRQPQIPRLDELVRRYAGEFHLMVELKEEPYPDPARQDPTTQFYVAYSYYRQGWGRMYNDDALFGKGLEAVEHAIAIAPGHRLDVADPGIDMRTADELRAELSRGLTREPSDLNPMRFLARRK